MPTPMLRSKIKTKSKSNSLLKSMEIAALRGTESYLECSPLKVRCLSSSLISSYDHELFYRLVHWSDNPLYLCLL